MADFKGEPARLFRDGIRDGRHVAGVGRVLAGTSRDAKIILSGAGERAAGRIGNAQPRCADGASGVSHSAFEPHPIQGWTPDFIPLVLQEAIDSRYYDELIPIAGPGGREVGARAAQKEGIFGVISRGATFGVAMRIAEKASPGSVIVAMLPDTGERYLSTPLFEGIAEDMDDEERAISKSTPG